MACPGGCVNGAGLPYNILKEEKKNRAKFIYQADETDAINLGCKSPVLINLNEKQIRDNKEISDKKLFHTQFAKRDVLL
jgi:iron only hydrogenase large subunit-like protein